MSELSELIKKLAETGDEVYSLVAKVESVDDTERTCTVIPIQNEEDKIYDVRLQADKDLTYGLCIFPKVSSHVIVTFLNSATGYVAVASEIDRMELVIGQTKLEVDGDKIKAIQGQSEVEIKGSQIKGALGQSTFDMKGTEIDLTVADKKVNIDPIGIAVSNGSGVSLKTILTTLIAEIINIDVLVVAGVGKLNPATIPNFLSLQTLVNTLLR